jgi:hypothetical protein
MADMLRESAKLIIAIASSSVAGVLQSERSMADLLRESAKLIIAIASSSVAGVLQSERRAGQSGRCQCLRLTESTQRRGGRGNIGIQSDWTKYKFTWLGVAVQLTDLAEFH